jgi:hypothetical protein
MEQEINELLLHLIHSKLNGNEEEFRTTIEKLKEKTSQDFNDDIDKWIMWFVKSQETTQEKQYFSSLPISDDNLESWSEWLIDNNSAPELKPIKAARVLLEFDLWLKRMEAR